jgi:hypothetical protein
MSPTMGNTPWRPARILKMAESDHPDFDFGCLIGMTPDEATAVALEVGIEAVRVLDVEGDRIPGPIDLVIRRDRLNLHVEHGVVVQARFDGWSPPPIV